MSRRGLTAALIAAAAVALPANASAGSPVDVTTNIRPLVAAGEGTTTCQVSSHVYDRPFSDHFEWHATTDCEVPVEHVVTEAWFHGGEGGFNPFSFYSGPCSGVRTGCVLGGSEQGEFQSGSVRHHIRLRAPLGQGWVVAPVESCSGIGTDLLDCTLGS